MEALPVLIIILSITIWTLLGYIEHHQLWTLRFYIAPWLADLIVLPVLSVAYLLWEATQTQISEDFTRDVVSSFFIKVDLTFLVVFLRATFRIFIAGCGLVFVVGFVKYVLPFWESRRFLSLRWKVWSGASRTRIAPVYAGLLGEGRDWDQLSTSTHWSSENDVGQYLWMLNPFTEIRSDPTDLLKTLVKNKDKYRKEASSEPPVPPKHSRNVYEPFLRGQSASLLWGKHLGFARRCSQGIVSVPKCLLNHKPTFDNYDAGYDGRPFVLAYGILARNKGSKPWGLVCNLSNPKSIRLFEENCRQWPRPSKCLRTIYRTEMNRTFALLGESFVTAATELALLLADTDYDIIEDWLDGMMEQQDLSLNHTAAQAGASPEDLARLYSIQYAVMLVSLASHQIGIRYRPELLVYEALCRRLSVEGKSRSPPWIQSSLLVERRKIELATIGIAGQSLIAAVI